MNGGICCKRAVELLSFVSEQKYVMDLQHNHWPYYSRSSLVLRINSAHQFTPKYYFGKYHLNSIINSLIYKIALITYVLSLCRCFDVEFRFKLLSFISSAFLLVVS